MSIQLSDLLERTEERLSGKQVFFLGGCVKSGTTWLERLLDAHPQVVCKGEAHFGTDVIDPISSLLEAYNRNIQTKGAASVHLAKYGGHTEVLSYDSTDLQVLSVVAVARMFEKWISDPGILCVGDKTPDNLRYFERLSEFFPRAKFIHILRDGRDVTVSLWHFNLKNDIGKTMEHWGTFDRFVEQFTDRWVAMVENGRRAGEKIGPERYMEIRYEDLLIDPGAQLARVLHFLSPDIDTSREIIDSCNELASFRALSGGREAGDEDSESFFRKGVAGDWKQHFDEKCKSAFVDRGGHLLRKLGYEVA